MDEFLCKLADILEVDEVKPTDALEDFPEWDSLSVLSVIAMIDAHYAVNLAATDLKGIGTAQALYELVAARKGN